VVHAKLELADPAFAPCCDHPLLAEAATAVLGPDRHLAALSLRAPLPGCGHQGLHPDFEQRRTAGRWQTLSAMWCITAFTPDNGPLRVIPGSHRVSQPPIDMLAFGSGMGPHPDEVKIIAPAGSVIMFNSADLWHSGTLNYSPAPRLAVTAGFNPGIPLADTQQLLGVLSAAKNSPTRVPSGRVTTVRVTPRSPIRCASAAASSLGRTVDTANRITVPTAASSAAPASWSR
jgi:ectoine hydroxylase-related dioxygenase (phytanoyl-CoA dioxygenase family)